MCKFLVAAVYSEHPDPVEDRYRFKPGQVPKVYEDDHVFSAKQQLPRFFQIEVKNAPVAALKFLEERQDENDDGIKQGIPGRDDIIWLPMFRRRRWMVDVTNLPAGLLKQLQSTGFISVSMGVIRSAVFRIRDSMPVDTT